MEIDPAQVPWTSTYKILIGSILPRPIGWISSVDPGGSPNLAPFSFFNAVSGNPPHVLFCPMIRGSDGSTKDTLNNVRAQGEFVVNVVTEGLAEPMNITATEFPPGVNEFEEAGLTPAPSLVVRPPRVAESPIHFECRVVQIVDLGDHTGAGSVVIGQVVHIHVEDHVLLENDKIDLARLKPIGRLAGAAYCRVSDIFEIRRLPSQIRQKLD